MRVLVLMLIAASFVLPIEGQNGIQSNESPKAIYNAETPVEDVVPTIEVWHGEEQVFGRLGDTQPLINILGSITHSEIVADVTYRLNGRGGQQVVLGPDLHRLANPGDFNLEIERSALRDGENTVDIKAYTRLGRAIKKQVRFHYHRGRQWPLPYEVDFSKPVNLQDVVEFIDGRWVQTDDGIRTAASYYDRQLAFGDSSWTDFELHAEVTFHHHFVNVAGRNKGGPPYLSHAHASFNMRWAGHPDDGYSPRRDWMSLGSLVAMRRDLAQLKKGSYWWMHFGKGVRGKPAKRSLVQSERRFAIEPGSRWHYRIRVRTIDEFQSEYSAKIWQSGQSEPADWQMQSIDASETVPAGAVVFVVHHSDVTLCNVRVEGLSR